MRREPLPSALSASWSLRRQNPASRYQLSRQCSWFQSPGIRST